MHLFYGDGVMKKEKTRSRLAGRMLTMVLSLLLAFSFAGSIARIDAFAEASGTVTRAEWLTALVDTFEMTVEEDDVLPDNYFSDLDPSSDYYRDFLVAVEFGLVNVEAGSPVYPDDPVTRDFAATTLNYCLAFQVEDGTTYSFSDVDDVTDPVSAQVAVNRGWLELIDGKFSPETNITVAEKTTMLADASEVWHSTDIDESHKDTYKVKAGVIEVPDGTEIVFESDPTETETGSIQIIGCPVELNSGDTFVVHINDIPVAYKAVSVEKNGNDLTVTTEYVELTDAFDELDIQGTLDGNAEMTVEPAEGVEMKIQTAPETGAQKLTRKITGRAVVKVRNLEASKKFDLGGGAYSKFDAKLKDIKINYQVNLFGTSSVELTGNMFVACTAGLDIDLLKDLDVTIAEVGVPGVGGVRLYAEANLSGKVTVSTSGKLTAGVSAGIGQGFRTIKKFKTTSFSCVTEISAYAGLKTEMGLYGSAVPFKGYLYAETGINGLYICADYADGTPRQCVTYAGWVSASYGAKLSCKYIGLNKEWSETIYNLDNSPVRLYKHYEDRSEVPKCTRPDDFAHYGKPFGYYTKGGSPYWGNGWAYGMGSHGFDEYGEPIEIYKYEVIERDYEKYAEITGFYGNVRALTIPETIDGYTVVSIRYNTFKDKKQITSVSIADTVETIGSNAFYGCTNLSYVHLPDNIKTIGFDAFGNADGLTAVEIPKSLESCGLQNDERGPFADCDNLKNVTFEEGTVHVACGLLAGCTGLEEITIPDTVTTIDYRAFRKATNLKKVTYSRNLTEIGYDAFRACTSLTSVNPPDSLTSIREFAYYNCNALTELTLPKNIKTIGRLAFGNDDGLTAVEIPKSLESCGLQDDDKGPFADCDNLKNVTFEEGTVRVACGLFAGCTGLEEITIPDTVTTIDYRAFRNAANLNKVTYSRNLAEIGYDAFRNCTSLTSGNLPDSMTSIREFSYLNCKALTELTLPKNIKTIGRQAFGNADGLTAVEIPKSLESCGLQDDDKGPFADCDSLKNVTFEEGTVRVACGLFAGCTGLEEITIPDTITTIDYRAFRNAANLKKVTYSRNLAEIGYDAFRNCTSLTSGNLPDNLTSIREFSYLNCKALTELTLPKNIKTIGRQAFGNADGLTAVEIPKSLESCGLQDDDKGPFADCDSLKNVTFEEGTVRVACGLFAGCTGLEEITIPDTVTTIDYRAFRKATGLKKAMLPEGLKSIGYDAFRDCSALQEINLPSSLTELGVMVFSGCSSLKAVTLPPGITKIGQYSFYGTTSLKTLTWNDTVTEIGNNAFYGSGIEETVVPDSVTKIEYNAFAHCPALKKITLPDYIESFGNEVFTECDALEEVNLGNGITTVPRSTFEGCDVIQKIVLPHRVTTIAQNAFKNCPELTEVTMFRNVSSVDSTAFSYAYKMTIYGVAGTYAETFANENGMKFVAIDNPATEVAIDQKEITLNRGASKIVALTVTPADYTDAVSWKSSDESIVTVSDNGKLTAKAVGTATIKVVVGSKSASCKVTVVQPVTSISLNYTSLTLDGGATYQLVATPQPSNAENKEVVWSTSDEKVATVSENGLVTAHTKGTANIRVTSVAVPSVYRECKVTVANNGYIITDIDEFESPHNYEDNCTDRWIYTDSGASALKLTFADTTEIEDGFDYLYIYNADGSEQGKYTGSSLAGKTVEVSGDTVTIKLVSDDSGNEWGFKVTSVERVEAPCEHEWSEWTVTKEASCTVDGLKSRTCSKCGEVETEVIKAEGHKPEVIEGYEATCTESGLTDGEKCSVCGEILTEQTVIPALGHDYDADVTEPTCTEGGFTTYTCSRCGDSYVADETAALGHDWSDWKEVTPATEEAAGLERRTCSRCDAFEERAIPSPGHTHTLSHVDAAEATCTEPGNIEHWICTKCKLCFSDDQGENQIDDVTTPALGHDYKATVTEPTCTEAGYTTYTCSRCGDSYTGGETAALGHQLSNVDRVEPTYESEGCMEHWKCERCGKLFSDAAGKTEVSEADVVIPPLDKEEQEKADAAIHDSEEAITTAETEDGKAAEQASAAEATASTDKPDDTVIDSASEAADDAVKAAKEAYDAAQKALDAAKAAYGEGSTQALAAEAMVASARALLASTTQSKATAAQAAATSATKKAASAKAAATAAAAKPGQAAVNAANAAKKSADAAVAKAKDYKASADAALEAAEDFLDNATDDQRASATQAMKNALKAAAEAETAVSNAEKEASAAAAAVKDAQNKKAAAEAKAREAVRQGKLNTTLPKLTISKPAAAKKAITVKWKKLTSAKKKKAQKIEIWVCPNKSFGPNDTVIKTVSKGKSSYKVKGLKAKTKYYIKVRTIKNINGVKNVSKWSKTKNIKTK